MFVCLYLDKDKLLCLFVCLFMRDVLNHLHGPRSVLVARTQPRRQAGSELAHLELTPHRVGDTERVIATTIRCQEREVEVAGTVCEMDSQSTL